MRVCGEFVCVYVGYVVSARISRVCGECVWCVFVWCV